MQQQEVIIQHDQHGMLAWKNPDTGEYVPGDLGCMLALPLSLLIIGLFMRKVMKGVRY